LGRLRQLCEQYKRRVAFLFVQIDDAPHEQPSRLLDAYRKAGLERATEHNRTGRLCLAAEVMELPFPCLLDTPDARTETLYQAWPERLLIVDTNGRIALDCGRGLASGWNFREAENCLDRLIGSRAEPAR
jgi:hypothetical protein